MHGLVLGGALALADLAAAAQSANVQVEQTGERQYRLHVDFPGQVEPTQAQAMLAGVASQLCEGTNFGWGHYRFSSKAPLTGSSNAGQTRFEQDLDCDVGSATKVRPGTPAPGTPATDAERRDVASRTEDYLARKDSGDFASADAMFDADVLAQVDRAKWRDERRAFNAKSGAPISREVVGVTFYDDPPDAPRLGRYAAVDYRARYKDRAFYCGYVVWVRQADGNYRLIREDETIVTDENAAGLDAQAMAALKQRPGCREPAL